MEYCNGKGGQECSCAGYNENMFRPNLCSDCQHSKNCHKIKSDREDLGNLPDLNAPNVLELTPNVPEPAREVQLVQQSFPETQRSEQQTHTTLEESLEEGKTKDGAEDVIISDEVVKEHVEEDQSTVNHKESVEQDAEEEQTEVISEEQTEVISEEQTEVISEEQTEVISEDQPVEGVIVQMFHRSGHQPEPSEVAAGQELEDMPIPDDVEEHAEENRTEVNSKTNIERGAKGKRSEVISGDQLEEEEEEDQTISKEDVQENAEEEQTEVICGEVVEKQHTEVILEECGEDIAQDSLTQISTSPETETSTKSDSGIGEVLKLEVEKQSAEQLSPEKDESDTKECADILFGNQEDFLDENAQDLGGFGDSNASADKALEEPEASDSAQVPAEGPRMVRDVSFADEHVVLGSKEHRKQGLVSKMSAVPKKKASAMNVRRRTPRDLDEKQSGKSKQGLLAKMSVVRGTVISATRVSDSNSKRVGDAALATASSKDSRDMEYANYTDYMEREIEPFLKTCRELGFSKMEELCGSGFDNLGEALTRKSPSMRLVLSIHEVVVSAGQYKPTEAEAGPYYKAFSEMIQILMVVKEKKDAMDGRIEDISNSCKRFLDELLDTSNNPHLDAQFVSQTNRIIDGLRVILRNRNKSKADKASSAAKPRRKLSGGFSSPSSLIARKSPIVRPDRISEDKTGGRDAATPETAPALPPAAPPVALPAAPYVPLAASPAPPSVKSPPVGPMSPDMREIHRLLESSDDSESEEPPPLEEETHPLEEETPPLEEETPPLKGDTPPPKQGILPPKEGTPPPTPPLEGDTPKEQGTEHIVTKLLKAGIDDAKAVEEWMETDYGKSIPKFRVVGLLFLACKHGCIECVKKLFKGFDVHYRTDFKDSNQTPLHMAAYHGQLEIVKWLLEELNAPTALKNKQKETTFQTAIGNQKKEIAEFIKAFAKKQKYEGKIKYFTGKGGGRIVSDDGELLAVYKSQIEFKKYLEPGQKVTFSISHSKKAAVAVNVRPSFVEGKVVEWKSKGYGFIHADGTSSRTSVFVHVNSIDTNEIPAALSVGQRVKFLKHRKPGKSSDNAYYVLPGIKPEDIEYTGVCVNYRRQDRFGVLKGDTPKHNSLRFHRRDVISEKSIPLKKGQKLTYKVERLKNNKLKAVHIVPGETHKVDKSEKKDDQIWQFEDNLTWKDVSLKTCRRLTEMSKSKKRKAVLTINGRKFEYDFDKFQQTSVETGYIRRIRRKSHGDTPVTSPKPKPEKGVEIPPEESQEKPYMVRSNLDTTHKLDTPASSTVKSMFPPVSENDQSEELEYEMFCVNDGRRRAVVLGERALYCTECGYKFDDKHSDPNADVVGPSKHQDIPRLGRVLEKTDSNDASSTSEVQDVEGKSSPPQHEDHRNHSPKLKATAGGDSQLESRPRTLTPPHLSQEDLEEKIKVTQQRILELLEENDVVPALKFAPTYHKKFKEQLKVKELGFKKLADLLQKLPAVMSTTTEDGQAAYRLHDLDPREPPKSEQKVKDNSLQMRHASPQVLRTPGPSSVTNSPSLAPKRAYRLNAEVEIEETRYFEFKSLKKSARLVERIKENCEKYLISFLNSAGGTIYFGIEDDGRVSGLRFSRNDRDKIRRTLDSLVRTFQPVLSTSKLLLTFVRVVGGAPDLYVLEVSVPRGDAFVYTTKNSEPWVRGHGSVHLMTALEIANRTVHHQKLDPVKDFQMPNPEPIMLGTLSSEALPSSAVGDDEEKHQYREVSGAESPRKGDRTDAVSPPRSGFGESTKRSGVCKFFVKGICSKADNCEFSHPDGSIICTYFLSTSCKHKEECQYHHPFWMAEDSSIEVLNFPNSRLNGVYHESGDHNDFPIYKMVNSEYYLFFSDEGTWVIHWSVYDTSFQAELSGKCSSVFTSDYKKRNLSWALPDGEECANVLIRKVKVCSYYARGICSKGKDCTFLHDPKLNYQCLYIDGFPEELHFSGEYFYEIGSDNGYTFYRMREEECYLFFIEESGAWVISPSIFDEQSAEGKIQSKETDVAHVSGPWEYLKDSTWSKSPVDIQEVWFCPKCTCINAIGRESCNDCLFLKPEMSETPST